MKAARGIAGVLGRCGSCTVTDGATVRRAMPKSRKGGSAPTDTTAKGEPVRTAVAIRYQPTDASSAPKVVASGRGWIAEKILEVAFAHGVKVREDPDLAEILAAVDLDEEIPVEAFIAVAEILRYVYTANGTQPPEVSRT